MQRQKDWHRKKSVYIHTHPRLAGVQYATGEEQRNSSKKNEEARPKEKCHSAVDVFGGESKVWCCKEQYCMGTWNVRVINQGKLEMSSRRWTRVGKFNSDDHDICYCGQESLRRNGIALLVNKRVWNTVLGCNLKSDRMIFVRYQGKAFSITVIQVYAPNTNAEEVKLHSSTKTYKTF